MFNLEFFRCLEKHVFPSWAHSSYGLKDHVAMGFSWAQPWALGRTPGPCNFSRKLPECWALSLNLWAAGQGSWALTWLESAGEGWGRLDKAPGPVWAWISWSIPSETLWHTQNTLAHSLAGTLLANP